MPKTAIPPGGMGQPTAKRLETGGWEIIVRFRYLNGEKSQVKRRARRKTDAIDAAQTEARRRIDAGRGYADDSLSRHTPVPQAVEAYIDSEISSESTRSIYHRHLKNHIKPEMKALQVGELTTPIAEKFLTSRTSGVHKSCRAILSGCWGWLARRGVVQYNVISTTSPAPRGRVQEHRVSTSTEVAALLAAAHAYHLGWVAPAILTLAGTGLRRAEVAAIRWDDMREVDGIIYLDAARLKKRDNVRELVALPDLLVAELLEWKKKNGTEFFFPGHPPTRPMRGESIKTGLARFLTWARDEQLSGAAVTPEIRAALPERVGPRDFRRGVATAITDTESLYAAAAQLGHSRSSITEAHYIRRPRQVDHRAAIGVLLGEKVPIKYQNNETPDQKTS